jgi:hypothetical protein
VDLSAYSDEAIKTSIAMTTAEKLRQEGMQKGRQETVIELVRNAGKKGCLKK